MIIAKARRLIEILEKEIIKESLAKTHHPRVTVCMSHSGRSNIRGFILRWKYNLLK